MSVSVRAEGVTKTYQDGVRRVEVLRGVDLAVRPGPDSNSRLIRFVFVITLTCDPPTSIDRIVRDALDGFIRKLSSLLARLSAGRGAGTIQPISRLLSSLQWNWIEFRRGRGCELARS